MIAETGLGAGTLDLPRTTWTSARPVSSGWTNVNRSSRFGKRNQPIAESESAKGCRITQSSCAGGLGGSILCLRKPGKLATIWLVSVCQVSKTAVPPGRTVVCVAIVTAMSSWVADMFMAPRCPHPDTR